MWSCQTYAVDQHWTWDGAMLRTLNRCMDVTGWGTGNGSQVQLYDCHGGGNQLWVPQANGVAAPALTGRRAARACLRRAGPSALRPGRPARLTSSRPLSQARPR